MDRVVSGACFLTLSVYLKKNSDSGVFECDVAHRQSVLVLCMLYKIRCKCNTMHPLNGALPVLYV